MTLGDVLRHGWDWEPSVIAGCIALLAAYLALTRGRSIVRCAAFVTGDLLLLLVLVSPLDTLSDHYLFSAHMVQHLFLILIVPPLFLLGMPGEVFERILRVGWVQRVECRLRKPLPAWTIGTAALVFWHIPHFYDLTIRNEGIHILEHLLFLVCFTIFWWPVLAPLATSRLKPLYSVVYLFAGMAANSILAIVITFAPVGFYSGYLRLSDPNGWLSMIRYQWGITPGLDQEIGGILMWVPGGIVYLAAILGVLGVWYSSAQTDQEPAPRHAPEFTKLAER
jgi:cytochrome c oxidase assembly factor CtaG